MWPGWARDLAGLTDEQLTDVARELVNSWRAGQAARLDNPDSAIADDVAARPIAPEPDEDASSERGRP